MVVDELGMVRDDPHLKEEYGTCFTGTPDHNAPSSRRKKRWERGLERDD